MPRQGNGNYVLPAGNPVTPNTLITANWANTTMPDMGAALTDSLSRSGSGSMTASLGIVDGASSLPGLRFAAETASGLYRNGTGQYTFGVQGVEALALSSSAVSVRKPLVADQTLSVAGVTTLSDNLVVAGTVNPTTPLVVGQNLTVTGLAAIGPGASTVAGSLNVVGALTNGGANVVTEAPNDGAYYARRNLAWAALPTTPALPRGYKNGLITSLDVGDPAHDIVIGSGVARDLSDTFNLALTGPFVKRIDAPWAAGSGGGGMDTGTVSASTWYNLHVIRNASTGACDAIFSLSTTAPTMPSGYIAPRRIASVYVNASTAIEPFAQVANEFLFGTPFDAFNAATPASGLLSVQTPPNLRCRAILSLLLTGGSAAGNRVAVGSAEQTGLSSESTPALTVTNTVFDYDGTVARVITSEQVAPSVRLSITAPGVGTLNVGVLGWEDFFSVD